ncbi:MAG TPA: HAD family hydrolase, partial [Puia sp.]
MTETQFRAEVQDWISKAKNHRWNKLYTEVIYQPMLELMQYLRANGYKTYIVTGGGQDFVRVFSNPVYGVPAEQVVGTAITTTYKYDTATGKSSLLKNPKLMLNDNGPGKAQGIQLVIGRRPNAAFGNSTGDQQMLEYTKGGSGARLSALVLHDDSTREYAYGPAQGLPDSKVGTFTQALYNEAKKSGWIVISMKNDWKTIIK